MTEIESKKVVVSRTPVELYNYLCDLNNFQILLPTEKIENFQSDGESCTFQIKGQGKFGLKTIEKIPGEKIVLESVGAPFSFKLSIFMKPESSDKAMAWQIAEADLNPFLKMLVEKPLKNLFDHIADQLVIQLA